MKTILHLQCVLIIFWTTYCDEDICKTPVELQEKEEYCWTEEVEVVDRIVQRSKSVLNFAKRKLGIAVEEENEKQKCGYYQCILRQLHLLNANDYPSYEAISDWSQRYVIYFQALGLMEQLSKCNYALANSTLLETHFYADSVVEVETAIHNTTEKSAADQSTCDIAAEFIDCLSRQKECPVFSYP